jgi:hypothetical protein
MPRLLHFSVTVIACAIGGAFVDARQAGTPLAPLSLINSAVGLRASFAWAPNPAGVAATAFQLQAGSGPGLADLAVIQLPANQTAFAADAPAGVYYVRVVAVNAAGASPPSNEVIVTLGGGGACVVPGPPTNLVATATASGVSISWNAPTTGGAQSGYVLDVGSVSGASDLGSFALPNTTTLSSAAPPRQYFLRLRAVNACGSSAPSTETSVTVGGGTAPVGTLVAGTYSGQMFNNTRPGLGRPPISTFSLTLNAAVTSAPLVAVSGRWSDNAGCTRTTGIYAGNPSGRPQISVESLTCNDGDMILRVTSITGNVVEGTCNGGAGCTFRMVRP